jgi:hypothetical protein
MPTKGKTAFLAGLFLICMCVLMLQIIETRVLSVIAYYYLAFFAIGMAMFGMTAGSLFVYFGENLFPRHKIFEKLVWISSAFAISVVVSALLAITTVLTSFSGKADLLMMTVQWGNLVLILATPYVFAGMAISLALTRSPWPVPLVYGVDLLGAAAGCFVVLALLTLVDSVSAWLLVGAFGALGGVFFASAARDQRLGSERPQLAIVRAPFLPRPWILASGFAVLALANGAIQPYGVKLSMVKERIEQVTDPDSLILWNSFSRVNVSGVVEWIPDMWGPSPTMPATKIQQRRMQIDGSAASPMYRFDGDLSKLEFLKYDITNLAYSIRHDGRAAVIGVGGGRDLLSAAYFGFRDITGVELNPIFVNLLNDRLRDYNRVATLPGVRLYIDEGRSWFERSDQHFDLIQMSMVDTWAATGAGAFSLSENGLYTVEGWRVFFRHLTPTGLLTVSRWYSPNNLAETGRTASLAVAALRSEGIRDPQAHLYLAVTDNLATLIVSRAPFSTADLKTLTATVDTLRFTPVMRPGMPPTSSVLSAILDARTPEALASLSTANNIDLTPAYDDRPFFFQQLQISDPRAVLNAMRSSDGVVRGNLKAVLTLVLIIILSLALVLVTIVVPSLPSLRHVEPRIVLLGSAYFLLIGLGFMFVEMGLIQRISVYLGHPIYGLSIGLFGIIVSTGLGSLLSSRISLLLGTRLLVWVGLLSIYIAVLPYWLPALIDVFASAALPMRAMVALIAIVPCGVLMGFGFPTGMQIVNCIDQRPTPWFWAINGAAGVLASGLAVIISINFSINTTLWCGAVSYFLLGPIAVLLSKVGVAQQLKPRFALI